MPALSFVLLPAPMTVDPASVVKAFSALFPEAPRLEHHPSDKAQVLHFSSASGPTFAAVMPVPVPGKEAEEAVGRSLSAFRKGGFTLPPYGAHLVVTSMGEALKTAAGLARHTQIVAALAQATGAVGVYEGNAGATHHPEFYVSVAADVAVPAMLWNGVSLVRDGDRVELLSLGMAQLGLPDLLLVAPAAEGNEALAFFFDLLGYVAGRGAPIPDGETVGRDADEKLAVRYVPSPLDEAVEVARISMVD